MIDFKLNQIGLKMVDIERISAIFHTYPEIKKVILYGSRAKGNYKPFSDIDLTLIGSEITLDIQNKVENDLDDLLLPYKIDLSLYHSITNKDLTEHINRVGKVFYSSMI